MTRCAAIRFDTLGVLNDFRRDVLLTEDEITMRVHVIQEMLFGEYQHSYVKQKASKFDSQRSLSSCLHQRSYTHA